MAPDSASVPFWVVGNEGGFLPSLVGPVTQVLLGPAERYDIVIDFSAVDAGEPQAWQELQPPDGDAAQQPSRSWDACCMCLLACQNLIQCRSLLAALHSNLPLHQHRTHPGSAVRGLQWRSRQMRAWAHTSHVLCAASNKVYLLNKGPGLPYDGANVGDGTTIHITQVGSSSSSCTAAYLQVRLLASELSRCTCSSPFSE